MAKPKAYRKAVRIIIENGNKILVGWRTKKDGKTIDYYLFPGGGVDDGESVVQAAIKEAKEEVGVLVDNVRLIGYESKYDKEFDKPDRAAKYRGAHDTWVAASYYRKDSSLHGTEGDSFKYKWVTLSEAMAIFESSLEDSASVGKLAALRAYEAFISGVSMESFKAKRSLPSW